MRTLDKSTLIHPILCLLVASAIGCGDDTQAGTKPDGGSDGPLAPDTAKADAPLLNDTAQADAPWAADLATADAPSRQDTSTVDLPQSLETDGPSLTDASPVEVGTGVDSMPSVDALATTMASITFRLTNEAAQTVYLRSACAIPFDVTSTADGTVYTNQMLCACDCANAGCTGNVMCGQCAPPSGTAVQVEGTADLSWTAQLATLQTKTGTVSPFQCVSRAAIPTGIYRLTVVVYPTAQDAVAETNGKPLEQTFVLGTANATVAVAIH